MIKKLKTYISIPFIFQIVSLQENNFTVYCLMTRFVNCNMYAKRKIDTKYLIDKALQRKSMKVPSFMVIINYSQNPVV